MAKLKSVFIPHKGNSYKPHLIRHHVLAVLLLIVVGAQVLVNYQSTGKFQVLGYATNVSPSALLSLTNQNRSANGLGAYTNNSKLASAAQAKANHMIAKNYWSHVAPDGTTPWYFIDQSGYKYDRAGENLAYGFTTSSGVMNGWMNSPSHAANILDSGFKEVGFGIANGANYQGGENTVVVAMYGQPERKAPTPTTPSTTKPNETKPETPSNTPSEEPKEEAKPEEEQEEPKEETTNDESTQITNQDSLVQKGNDQSIAASRASTVAKGDTVTVFEALVKGDAHWSLYFGLGLLTLIAFIYAIRHLTAIYHLLVHGEHYVEGHPMLEASIIYAALWLIMVSSYGVIL